MGTESPLRLPAELDAQPLKRFDRADESHQVRAARVQNLSEKLQRVLTALFQSAGPSRQRIATEFMIISHEDAPVCKRRSGPDEFIFK